MYTVMLVDDEKGVRNSIKAKINWEEAGFCIVSEASSGSEALKLLEQGPLPHLVISDIRMPQMTGIEFIQICQNRYPDLRTAVLSGYSDFEYLKSAIKLGVKDYLLKPVARGELIELLARLSADLQSEFEEIQAAQRELVQKNEQLRMLQEHFLLQLVKEDWHSLSAVKERLIQLQLAPLSVENLNARFLAVEMRIPPGRLSGWEDRRDLLHLAFQMLCRETASQWRGIYPFADIAHSSIMYFLIATNDETQHSRLAEKFMEQLRSNISNVLRLDSVIGIGEPVTGINRLKNGYASCMLSWSQSTVHGQEGQETHGVLEMTHSFTPEVERKLIQAIENLDMKAFHRQLDAIFKPDQETPVFAFTFLALRVLLLFSSVAKKFEIAGSALQQYLWNCQMMISGLESRGEVMGQIDVLAEQVMEEVKKTRFSSGLQLAEAVRKYVEENFSYELTLSSLADMFHINETYLSGLFKQHVGITFSDYVTALRISKAEQLLRENELKLTDIAMLVGYSTSSYFSTCFKKSFGKSPKEYREEYLQQKNQV
ncbi:helix-turn-helix domain-containing protein [Paenibacillus sp. sgz500958]|uniref:helix-turn-helix domain-containing protein n=1 Tax=Paenibacillus sp. sgz500958 TaxID=3242475 RepID=UPI0036D2937B